MIIVHPLEERLIYNIGMSILSIIYNLEIVQTSTQDNITKRSLRK